MQTAYKQEAVKLFFPDIISKINVVRFKGICYRTFT